MTADWTASVTARGQRLSGEHLFTAYQRAGTHKPLKSKGSSQAAPCLLKESRKYPLICCFKISVLVSVGECVGAFVCLSWKLALCNLTHRLLTMLHRQQTSPYLSLSLTLQHTYTHVHTHTHKQVNASPMETHCKN